MSLHMNIYIREWRGRDTNYDIKLTVTRERERDRQKQRENKILQIIKHR